MTELYKGLKEELSEDLGTRVEMHRNRFVKLFTNRFLEMLPSLIVYGGDTPKGIDFLRVEIALRANYQIVIGENKLGNLQVLGYMCTSESSENPIDLFNTHQRTGKDITFIIDESLQYPEDDYKEISHVDNCESGNFVVLRNKTIQYVSDLEILKHYTTELAEIVLSRYSISMQAKIINFFKGNVGDETTNQLITKLYNGHPYAKVSELFDPEEQIVHITGSEIIPSLLPELKKEYQNKISELNNMLGINSLAVEKTSGVSDTEAKSNRAFTSSNANIYLKARQDPLDKLTKRYEMEKIEVLYNDEVASEFAEIAYSDTSGNEGNSIENDNDIA